MQHLSLDQQLTDYRQQRALAMPLSGMIIWSVLFVLSFFLPVKDMVLTIFIGTGSIVYVAMGISRLTGENITFKKHAKRNFFESLFLASVGMSFLVFSLTIALMMENHFAQPFALAVQTGLMWLVYGAITDQKVAVFHAVIRTLCCTLAYFIWPQHSFHIQPLIVVCCYAFTIPVMEHRWHLQQQSVLHREVT